MWQTPLERILIIPEFCMLLQHCGLLQHRYDLSMRST